MPDNPSHNGKASRGRLGDLSSVLEERRLGDFYLRKKLGAGSMGIVFLAQQISRNRPAALKVLYRQHAEKSEYIERFYREAALMARLSHPNLIRCYRAGREKGLCYIGMEYVHGISLRAVMQHPQQLPLSHALHVIAVCAEALQHAHSAGVVHRDVKPTNILLTSSGELKIADMGLARCTEQSTSLTLTGVGMGTPEYMPPEQARDARNTDHRADIYALGTIFYELLTGALPFRGASAVDVILAKEQTFFIPASRLNPDVPESVDALLTEMLKPDPARRLPSCERLGQEIQRLGIPLKPFNLSTLGITIPGASRAMTPDSILIVHPSTEPPSFAEQPLKDLGYHGPVHVVQNGNDALARLRREGDFAKDSLPCVITLTVPFCPLAGRALFDELFVNEDLLSIPVVVVASSAAARAVLRSYQIEACSHITEREELQRFETLLPGAGIPPEGPVDLSG